MIPIKHDQIKEIAQVAQGDFCFVTEHTRHHNKIKWAYSLKLNDYGGASIFLSYYGVK